MVKLGNSVLYTCLKDSDVSPIPNVVAAIVVKVHPLNKVDLKCFTSSGEFNVQNVSKGLASVRGTWHKH